MGVWGAGGGGGAARGSGAGGGRVRRPCGAPDRAPRLRPAPRRPAAPLPCAGRRRRAGKRRRAAQGRRSRRAGCQQPAGAGHCGGQEQRRHVMAPHRAVVERRRSESPGTAPSRDSELFRVALSLLRVSRGRCCCSESGGDGAVPSHSFGHGSAHCGCVHKIFFRLVSAWVLWQGVGLAASWRRRSPCGPCHGMPWMSLLDSNGMGFVLGRGLYFGNWSPRPHGPAAHINDCTH